MIWCWITISSPSLKLHLFLPTPHPVSLSYSLNHWLIDDVRCALHAVRMASRSFEGRWENSRPAWAKKCHRKWWSHPPPRLLVFERQECFQRIEPQSILSYTVAVLTVYVATCVSARACVRENAREKEREQVKYPQHGASRDHCTCARHRIATFENGG